MARLINPLSGMFLLVAVYLAYTVVMIAYGEYASEEAYSVFAFVFTLLLMWWVYRDRHRRGYPVPFEFEAFVFFAWPLVVPYYLFRTRGIRAAPLCIALGAAIFLAYLSELVAYEIFWR